MPSAHRLIADTKAAVLDWQNSSDGLCSRLLRHYSDNADDRTFRYNNTTTIVAVELLDAKACQKLYVCWDDASSQLHVVLVNRIGVPMPKAGDAIADVLNSLLYLPPASNEPVRRGKRGAALQKAIGPQ